MGRRSGRFYEFFAGGGLARLGLGERWRCVFANEISEKKARAYRLNFGEAPELLVRDVREVSVDHLAGPADLAWASFPCQDLSLAGNGRGLQGERSGTFWPFWDLMTGCAAEGRPVPLIVIENVVGAITSNEGRDFAALLEAITRGGYRVGPMVIDAVDFLPQSRPRLFLVAVHSDVKPAADLVSNAPIDSWHPRALRDAWKRLPEKSRRHWIWWNLPRPPAMRERLTELIDEEPSGVVWHSQGETERVLSLMSPTHRQKVDQALAQRSKIAGSLYKRMRSGSFGDRLQRAEVRFDQVSGCLRTPAGGSSRQTIVVVENGSIRTRLLSAREAARLMGAPDYVLPEKYNEAYQVMGDGVVVPVVSWIEKHLLRPIVEGVLHKPSVSSGRLNTPLSKQSARRQRSSKQAESVR